MTIFDVTARGTTPAVTSWPADRPDLTRVSVAGCPVDLCEASTFLRIVRETVRDDRRAPLAVASANLDHLHHFGPDGRHRELLPVDRDGLRWLTLLDGSPLVSRVRRWSGEEHPRLAGSDLIGPVLADATREGASVGFLGGSAQMHEVLRDRLAQDHPGLRVAGCWAPTREELGDAQANARLAQEIRASGVDVLVVGLGKPRQELWIDQFGEQTGARVLLAFGASADFLAGQVTRAPQWLRDHGLEWSYRLVQEPRRLGRRYLVQGPGAMARLLLEPVQTLSTVTWR